MGLLFGQDAGKGTGLVQNSLARCADDTDKTFGYSTCDSVAREVLTWTGFGTKNERAQHSGLEKRGATHAKTDPGI
jgi:hypothetical protein